MAKLQTKFRSFFWEMLGFIHNFVTHNSNPKLSMRIEATLSDIKTVPRGFYMYFL